MVAVFWDWYEGGLFDRLALTCAIGEPLLLTCRSCARVEFQASFELRRTRRVFLRASDATGTRRVQGRGQPSRKERSDTQIFWTPSAGARSIRSTATSRSTSRRHSLRAPPVKSHLSVGIAGDSYESRESPLECKIDSTERAAR
jgi:hypothetical protein